MTSPKSQFRKKTVLLVDDNENSRNGLKVLFEISGAVVYSAGHLEKVLILLGGMTLENKMPDLIVMDVRLPQCYGLQALREVYAFVKERDCPIIVVSHGFNSIAVSQMMLHGAIGYVRKPVLTEKLFEFATRLFVEREKLSRDFSMPSRKSA